MVRPENRPPSVRSAAAIARSLEDRRSPRTGDSVADAIQDAWDAVYDDSVLRHAYADYLRDYEFVILHARNPDGRRRPKHSRFLLKHCVEVDVRSALTPRTWIASLDDVNLDIEQWSADQRAGGHVWAVKHQELHPGASVVAGSARAQHYSATIGVPFYEVLVVTNAQRIALVFAELVVTPLDRWP
jgi:hypothetical protein